MLKEKIGLYGNIICICKNIFHVDCKPTCIIPHITYS